MIKCGWCWVCRIGLCGLMFLIVCCFVYGAAHSLCDQEYFYWDGMICKPKTSVLWLLVMWLFVSSPFVLSFIFSLYFVYENFINRFKSGDS